MFTNLNLNIPPYHDPQLSSLGDDRWYVLGQAFYEKQMSDVTPLVEQYVQRMLNGGKITFTELLDFHEKVKTLPAVHRYYLQLMLIIMIKLETNRACEC